LTSLLPHPTPPFLVEWRLTIGIVGGVVGFMILAFLLMSFVLYVLVRRSVEKRHAKNQSGAWERKHSPSQSRTSVAASDTPEVRPPPSPGIIPFQFEFSLLSIGSLLRLQQFDTCLVCRGD